MIFFKPEIIDESNAKFKALDGDVLLGSCKMTYSSELADVVEMTIDDNNLAIGEGLLRAAYNFAANKGVYMGQCSAKAAFPIAEKMNFELKDGVYINDIPSILMGSCH